MKKRLKIPFEKVMLFIFYAQILPLLVVGTIIIIGELLAR